MYTFLRSCRNPLKRGVCLVPTHVFGNAYKFSRPLMLNASWYGKKNDENEKGKQLNGKSGGSASGPLNISIVGIPQTIKDYEERNKQLGRRLSPCLSIYRPQLTSIMSILLRMTGFMLGFGVWIIGMSGLFFDININDLAEKIQSFDCSPAFFKALKFGIILPFAYHVVAGTRHLIWYLNVFLSKKEIYATGYVAALLTLLLAATLACINIHADQGASSVKADTKIRQMLLDEDDDNATRESAEDCIDEYENERECICQDDKEFDDR